MSNRHYIFAFAFALVVIVAVIATRHFLPLKKNVSDQLQTQDLTQKQISVAAKKALTTVDKEIKIAVNSAEKALFVGSEQCASCHQSQHQLWQQSHHRHAFSPANVDSVLGDFSSVAVNYTDGVATFEQQQLANKINYQIRLTGSVADPDDKIYPVVYTLGFFPLQQYIVETRPGNYQVFALAWDARKAEQGGQRWMDLSASASPDDPLNWRHYFQNWNSQCAACHTTGFSTNATVDPSKKHPTFHSTWSEPAVSCESCHGPASGHLAWAENKKHNKAESDHRHKGLIRQLSMADDWQFIDDDPIARRMTSAQESTAMSVIDGCASCHSLRQPISKHPHETTQTDWLNNFEPTRVREPLYFADGQIREEVFVYGSFAQSKMAHAGVTCLNCHDSHSGKVNGFDEQQLASPSNDAVCAQCHRADVFAVESHHHHPIESEAARCVTCHMPERTYMGVDPRRDHSFQKPSPALSDLLGTPNVCTHCHTNNTHAWAADQIEQWRQVAPMDESESLDFADWLLSFAKLNSRFNQPNKAGQVNLHKALDTLEKQRYQLLMSSKTPAMKKSMLLDTMPINHQQAFEVLVSRLSDDDVVVRLSAINIIRNFDLANRQQLLMPLLKDPIKSVRFAATLALADLLIAPNFNDSNNKKLLKENVSQLIMAYQHHGDLLASQMTLADLYRQMNDWEGVVSAYQKALLLVPTYVPALVNLADVYRMQQADDKAEELLLKAIAVTQDNVQQLATEAGDVYLSARQQQASVEYALGLLYARNKDYSKASASLKNATQLSSQNSDYFYAYLLILDGLGQRSQAVDLLQGSPLTKDNEQLMALLRQWQR